MQQSLHLDESKVSKQGSISVFKYASFAIDFSSAILAAWIAAPIVGSIDKATTQNMAGTNTMKQSIKEEIYLATRNPHRWITSWQCFFTIPVYTLTYSTVNIFDTYFDNLHKNNPNYINPADELIKISAVTAVNVSISIWKDRMFARKYGAILPAGLPFRAYFLFLLRDATQMIFSFTFPTVLTKYVAKYNMIENENRDKFQASAQIISPAIATVISVYFHLWGLDIYNRRELKMWQRQSLIIKAYPATLGMFFIRVVGPFCIGPTINTYFRDSINNSWDRYVRLD